MKITGIDGMSLDQLGEELDRGGRFVLYTWTISIIVMTFKRPTDIMFVRSGESRFLKGLPYTLTSAVVGWWGIPWGPIYTLGSIFGNIRGKDLTQEVLNDVRASVARDAASATAPRAHATAG